MSNSNFKFKNISLGIKIAEDYAKRAQKEQGLTDHQTENLRFRKQMHGFTQEELDMVTDLKLENGISDDLSELGMLRNLKNLDLLYKRVRFSTTNINEKWNAEELEVLKKKIAQGVDFSSIETLSNLKTLVIKRQPALKSLDVSKMKNLFVLELVDNMALENVTGLDEISELLELDIYGSKNLNAFDFGHVKNQNEDLQKCTFDMSLLPDFMRNSVDFEKDITYNDRGGPDVNLINVDFMETHSSINGIETKGRVNSATALRTYRKVQEVVKNAVPENATDYEKFIALYAWVIKNISYDYEAYEKELSGKSNDKIAHIRYNDADRIRSSYGAMETGKVVCAGYANLMVLMGKEAGVDIEYVGCSVHRGEGHSASHSEISSNHAIIKANLGRGTYYSDPTWDAEKEGKTKYLLKTKEEISESHALSYMEGTTKNAKSFTADERQKIIQGYREKMEKSKVDEPSHA